MQHNYSITANDKFKSYVIVGIVDNVKCRKTEFL